MHVASYKVDLSVIKGGQNYLVHMNTNDTSNYKLKFAFVIANTSSDSNESHLHVTINSNSPLHSAVHVHSLMVRNKPTLLHIKLVFQNSY